MKLQNGSNMNTFGWWLKYNFGDSQMLNSGWLFFPTPLNLYTFSIDTGCVYVTLLKANINYQYQGHEKGSFWEGA